MKPELKNLLYSRHTYSIGAIKEMVSNKVVVQEELAALLGSSIASDLLRLSQVAPKQLPAGGLYAGPKQSNIITLWGVPSSGRTSVIASLLSLEGMTPIKPVGSDDTARKMRSKIKDMCNVFQCQNRYQALPEMGSGSPEIYHAKYHHQWHSYNLSFLKASLEDWDEVNQVLDSNQRQIHIFCIDCRQDIDMQVEVHKQVIERLSNHLSQAAGVYVLVTKCDLMNCPELYLNNAAQTLVTASSASGLWRLIRNKCKTNLIYNEQPIVCSVGDFILTDYAQLSSKYTQQLCDKFIIRKCEHNHWGLVKLLKMGSKGMAALLFLLIVALAGLGVYKVFSMLGGDPTDPVKPFIYTSKFERDVDLYLNANAIYESASQDYDSLRLDLEVEGDIKTTDGQLVLPVTDYNRCDTKLSNAFSIIMTKRMQTFFSSNTWSQDSDFMPKALVRLNELYRHRDHIDEGKDSVLRYRAYLLCYRDSVTKVINIMDSCKSINSVDFVVRVAKRWAGEYPFSNDTHLDNSLKNAPRHAFKSCAERFEEKAEPLLRKNDNNGTWKRYLFSSDEYIRNKTNIDGIKSLRDQVLKLYHRVETENQEDDNYQYETLMRDLSNLYNKLNDELPESQKKSLYDSLKRIATKVVDKVEGLFD